MGKSIKWRLVTIFVVLVIIVMIIAGTMIVFQTRNNEYEYIEKDLVELADGFANFIDTSLGNDGIKNEINRVFSNNPMSLNNTKLFILDHTGQIMLSSDETFIDKEIYTSQVMSALNQGEVRRFDEISIHGEAYSYIGYASPIEKNNEVLFVVYAISSLEKVEMKVQEMLYVVLFAILIAIILSVILAFVFSEFLTKPISALTVKAREMSEGNLDNPMAVLSNDEIGELTTNFNQMALSLNETLAEIAREKNKMETVITHMTDGIIVFDYDGNCIHHNPAAIKMLGITSFKKYETILRNKINLSYYELVDAVSEGKNKYTIFVHELYYNVDFAKFLDKDGEVQGIITVLQDITEHKKLENMQKDFVANVSHELRTPLTTIKSYAETLIDGALDDKDIASQFLGVINGESDRMTTLVQDLLELSKLDNKKVENRDTINLKNILENSVKNYMIHALNKKQVLECHVDEGTFLILGDANRIEQVIKNLLSNAVKYSPEEATIYAALYTEGKYHIVSVIDNGMGMPEQDLPHIFDRFYRVDKARSRKMGGTGLGLAIAKEIMELHGGKIKVQSKVDEGTKFSLYFPIINTDKSVME